MPHQKMEFKLEEKLKELARVGAIRILVELDNYIICMRSDGRFFILHQTCDNFTMLEKGKCTVCRAVASPLISALWGCFPRDRKYT